MKPDPMNPERWEKVLRLYEAASALAGAEREAYLARECPDTEIAAEVRRLLGAPTSGGFLEPPALDEPAQGWDLGDFTLLEEIGRGGMGVVYRALQRPLQRIVAVKVLPVSFALTARQIERFSREACAAAKLTHPNLVTVLTVGEERGVRFFAMEYVDGKNLAEELTRLRADRSAEDDRRAHLPSSHASDYFRSVAESVRQVADGLAFAHENGIVHRDVKPSNLLLDPSGRVKLVDFGLARDEELGSLSNSGDVVGTPHYMSPEQARSQRNKVDHRTDIYSLGVVLYELLTLQRPFEGKTAQEVLDNVVQREPTRIRKLNPRVPRDLETICIKAMSKEPRGRYLDAGAMRDDLQRFLSHEAIVAKAPGVVQVLAQRARSHRMALGVLGIALLSAAVASWAQAHFRSARERQADLELVGKVLGESELRGVPLSRQLEFQAAMRRLAAAGVNASEPDGTVGRALRALDALHTELADEGDQDLVAARDPTLDEGSRAYRQLVGLLKLSAAAQLFPEDEELVRRARIESAYPSVEVETLDASGLPAAARVSLRPVDVFTSGVGAAVELGVTPLPPTPILPGDFRLVVTFENGAFREVVFRPGLWSMETHLVVRLREDEDRLTENMVAIPGGTYTFPDLEDELYGKKSVVLGGFWIDRTEVSNAQYARFVRATKWPSPVFWSLEPDLDAFLQRHGDLPVVGIGWSDANAYAAWAGKRLPTAAEWHRASGGLEGRAFPYSPDPAAEPRGNLRGSSRRSLSDPEYWSEYLASAAPVDSHPEAATPEGVLHLFGNVWEFLESPVATSEARGSPPVRRPFDCFYIGAKWDALEAGDSPRSFAYVGIGPTYASSHTGFRCARSSGP